MSLHGRMLIPGANLVFKLLSPVVKMLLGLCRKPQEWDSSVFVLVLVVVFVPKHLPRGGDKTYKTLPRELFEDFKSLVLGIDVRPSVNILPRSGIVGINQKLKSLE